MASGQTYLILEGVRRAKAWEQNGATVLPAQVLHPDGTAGAVIDVSVDDLLSPKSEIDLTDPREVIRYWRLWALIRNGLGRVLPLITITPGSRGTRLKDVVLRR